MVRSQDGQRLLRLRRPEKSGAGKICVTKAAVSIWHLAVSQCNKREICATRADGVPRSGTKELSPGLQRWVDVYWESECRRHGRMAELAKDCVPSLRDSDLNFALYPGLTPGANTNAAPAGLFSAQSWRHDKTQLFSQGPRPGMQMRHALIFL